MSRKIWAFPGEFRRGLRKGVRLFTIDPLRNRWYGEGYERLSRYKKKTMIDGRKEMENESGSERMIGRYVVSGVVGKGSMGIIFKGRDPYIKRTVAIKTAVPEESLSESQAQIYREQFFTEAQAAGALVHPNIVAVYDAGLENSICYIAMEFVDGNNLTNYCAKNKLLPFEKVIGITGKICEALDFAHQQGIIHRDIKPANIMLTRAGTVKVTDFGVAKLPKTEDCHTMGIIGSPGYMAPEALQHGQATQQSDLFSLGVTVYELLTGENPFASETMVEMIHKVLYKEPELISTLNPGVPEIISSVVMKSIAKDPINRYQGTMEFLFHLKTALRETRYRAEGDRVDDRINYMKSIIFFNEFREDELAEVLRIGTWFHYKKGSVIVKEDETDTTFFVVILGRVQVEREGKVLAVIDRGSCFGEMAAFGKERRRTASIVATEDCVLIKIDALIIDHLSKDLQIRFYKQFLHTLINRLDSARKNT
ncbi:MAG: protein kinase [Deltaproteobacteria bacterium]|nr:protein kinase [Deltaproteobacteria bacterium]